MSSIYPPNATLIERIMAYVEHDLHEEAATLAALADQLEENYQWEIVFDMES